MVYQEKPHIPLSRSDSVVDAEGLARNITFNPHDDEISDTLYRLNGSAQALTIEVGSGNKKEKKVQAGLSRRYLRSLKNGIDVEAGVFVYRRGWSGKDRVDFSYKSGGFRGNVDLVARVNEHDEKLATVVAEIALESTILREGEKRLLRVYKKRAKMGKVKLTDVFWNPSKLIDESKRETYNRNTCMMRGLGAEIYSGLMAVDYFMNWEIENETTLEEGEWKVFLRKKFEDHRGTGRDMDVVIIAPESVMKGLMPYLHQKYGVIYEENKKNSKIIVLNRHKIPRQRREVIVPDIIVPEEEAA